MKNINQSSDIIQAFCKVLSSEKKVYKLENMLCEGTESIAQLFNCIWWYYKRQL